MSLWKYGDFEKDIDFTDADFLENLTEAKKRLEEEANEVPKTGKVSDIIRAQIACFDHFFDSVLGSGAGELIREGRYSLEKVLGAVDALNNFYDKEDKRVYERFEHYQVQNHGNRKQRRNYNKNYKNSYQKN